MILGLALHLKAQGEWLPELFVYDKIPGADPRNDLKPQFVTAGVPVTQHLKSPGFSWRLVLALREKLRTEKIQVLHTHDLGPLIYGVLAKLLCLGDIRLIHTQHSSGCVSGNWISKYYERFFTRFADELTVVSVEIKRHYADLHIPVERIHVVPNGISFPEGPLTAGRYQARKDLMCHLDEATRERLERFIGSHWLLYMARLHPTKGQTHALRLWEQLSPEIRAKSVLLFIGPESEAGFLNSLQSKVSAVPDCARILYLGLTHQPSLWLNCSDIALSCSVSEGMPLGPIEAAGAGLPLILTDIPGHEILKEVGSLYPLGDPGKGGRLVEIILGEIESDPNTFFKSAWAKAAGIRSLYTVANMCRAYSRLYVSRLKAQDPRPFDQGS